MCSFHMFVSRLHLDSCRDDFEVLVNLVHKTRELSQRQAQLTAARLAGRTYLSEILDGMDC
jgi:hypothetical protein